MVSLKGADSTRGLSVPSIDREYLRAAIGVRDIDSDPALDCLGRGPRTVKTPLNGGSPCEGVLASAQE
jgi:hypothetical protein